jgi:RNA recognition motif-containing protein
VLSDDPHKSEPYLTAKRIFIGGLRIDINEAKLQEYFSRFGNIREVLCVKNVFGMLKKNEIN